LSLFRCNSIRFTHGGFSWGPTMQDCQKRTCLHAFGSCDQEGVRFMLRFARTRRFRPGGEHFFKFEKWGRPPAGLFLPRSLGICFRFPAATVACPGEHCIGVQQFPFSGPPRVEEGFRRPRGARGRSAKSRKGLPVHCENYRTYESRFGGAD